MPYFDYANPPITQPDHAIKSKQFFIWGKECYDREDWQEATERFTYIEKHFPKSKGLQESFFYIGMSQFHLREYAHANIYLDKYLNGDSNPEFFRKAIETKFAIAEKYRAGEKRRFYDSKRLPKWAGGEMEAIEIYDEVIATIPCDELAIQSMYCKGLLLFDIGMYNDAVSALQVLIRRFPKHELALDSYVLIEEIFLVQSEIETQNTDLLELARINLRHFEQDFPKDERVAYAQDLVRQIEETFAISLFNIGQLYERKGEISAASIYYLQAIKQFPETSLAKDCHARIEQIAPKDMIEKSFAYLNRKE